MIATRVVRLPTTPVRAFPTDRTKSVALRVRILLHQVGGLARRGQFLRLTAKLFLPDWWYQTAGHTLVVLRLSVGFCNEVCFAVINDGEEEGKTFFLSPTRKCLRLDDDYS